MKDGTTRRQILRGGITLAGLSALHLPEWMLPVLAQGETIVPFTDLPTPINLAPTPDRRVLDIRTIDGPFTPKDKFFTTQHYGHPSIDLNTFQLKISGLVDRPTSFSLDTLRKMGATTLTNGFECSGNRRPLQGLCSNGQWTGVPLRSLLERAGVKAQARQVVFFGADHMDEEVEFRNQKFTVDQQFGRSLTREQALGPDLLVAYALNGDPLTVQQGSPLRLIVPGWYGVANVKWLSQIHVQEDEYLGKFQARWYRTLKGEMIDGQIKWTEAAITRMQIKSFVARVTRDGSTFKALGVALTDGTPLKSVEVRVDDGPWQPAAMDKSTAAKYSWKLFTHTWSGSTPGEHTIVSRATDINGKVQPTAEELDTKKTFLEDNSQHPRKIMIA